MITLKTLPQATAQQVFDQVANHLLNQGKKSMIESTCRLRGEKNLMCAAGCLISDEEYNSSWEDKAWLVLAIDGAVPKNHKHLIQELQQIHDGCSVFRWREELKNIATEYNLKFI